jgi:hypothetical protein
MQHISNQWFGVLGASVSKQTALAGKQATGGFDMRTAFWLLVVVFALLPTQVYGQPTVYNAADDFSATQNPNGVWSYGWSPTLGGTFNLYMRHDIAFGLDLWRDQTDPNVSHNGTGALVDTGSSIWPVNQLALHPGQDGEFSVVCWTAPEAGFVSLVTIFTGLDYLGPTTTDVHVLLNGVSLFGDVVEGFLSETSFITNLTVAPGDTIEFAVGIGPDGDYFDDTTGLFAVIFFTPSD